MEYQRKVFDNSKRPMTDRVPQGGSGATLAAELGIIAASPSGKGIPAGLGTPAARFQRRKMLKSAKPKRKKV